MKSAKGITLIALIVTIIVLIILAGISVNLLFGNNGILNKSKQSSLKNERVTAEEDIQMSVAGAYTKYMLDWSKDNSKAFDVSYLTANLLNENKTDDTAIFTQTNGKMKYTYITNSGEKIRFTVNSTGKIEFLGQPMNPNDIYVTLSEDQTTLRFYSQKDNVEGNLYKENDIPINLKDTIYTTQVKAPWYANRETITNVLFEEKIAPTSTAYWFHGCKYLTNLEKIENLNTCNVTSMEGMFYVCQELLSLDLSNFDTENVTNMRLMFQNCKKLTELDLSNFDTSNVTNMEDMFEYCYALTKLDLSNFNVINVNSMRCMFSGCSNLTQLDLSSFDTKNVTNMQTMFYNCSKLSKIYVINDWNTDSVTKSEGMFSYCQSIKGGDSTVYSGAYADKTRAKIDHGNKDPGYFDGKNEIHVGDYIQYAVEYKDMYTDYEFTSTDGWRYLGNNQIISTGVPVILCYSSGDTNETNTAWWGSTSISENPNARAEYGLINNFEKINFKYKSLDEEKRNQAYQADTGIFRHVGNYTSGTLPITKEATEEEEATISPFIAKDSNNVLATSAHALTKDELSKIVGYVSDRVSLSTKDENNLFYLRGLEKYGYSTDESCLGDPSKTSYGCSCWLTARGTSGNYDSNKLCLWMIFHDGTVYTNNAITTSGHYGIRVVVTLPSDFEIIRVNK